MVLVRAVAFCHDEHQSTGPEKRDVLERFSRAIGLSPAPNRTGGRDGWLRQVRRGTTGLPAKDQHLAELTELWLSGRSSNQESRAGLLELMRELDATRELQTGARSNERFEFEMQTLRLDIQCMALKTMADYCATHDWQDGDRRRQAVERFQQALGASSRRSR